MKKKVFAMIDSISTYEQLKAVMKAIQLMAINESQLMAINEIMGSETFKEANDYQQEFAINEIQLMAINEMISSETFKEANDYLLEFAINHNMIDDYSQALGEILSELLIF